MKKNKKIRINITITKPLLKRVDDVTDYYKRSDFINHAIEEKLLRLQIANGSQK